MIRLAALLCALLPAACAHRGPPAPTPHYVLGAPYQAGGVWRYPRERYDTVLTGLATVYADGHPALTADGEVFDQTALAAAHPTLQLPAIARLTDLETGRQVLLRINDRGPATPHRLIEVTRRTARLLGFPASGTARVRLEILPAESHAAVESLPGAPGLAITAAPRAAVQEIPLGPAGSLRPAPAWTPTPQAVVSAAPTAPPMRLPDSVTQTLPAPGLLWVQLSSFQGYRYAAIQRARLANLNPEIVAGQHGGEQEYRVRTRAVCDNLPGRCRAGPGDRRGSNRGKDRR